MLYVECRAHRAHCAWVSSYVWRYKCNGPVDLFCYLINQANCIRYLVSDECPRNRPCLDCCLLHSLRFSCTDAPPTGFQPAVSHARTRPAFSMIHDVPCTSCMDRATASWQPSFPVIRTMQQQRTTNDGAQLVGTTQSYLYSRARRARPGLRPTTALNYTCCDCDESRAVRGRSDTSDTAALVARRTSSSSSPPPRVAVVVSPTKR